MSTDPRNIPGFVVREARAQVDLPATITSFSAPDVEAHIRNLSVSGFSAICERPLAIGSQIIVASPSIGRLPAQVRWALGTRIGALFNGVTENEVKAAIARHIEAPASGRRTRAGLADPCA